MSFCSMEGRSLVVFFSLPLEIEELSLVPGEPRLHRSSFFGACSSCFSKGCCACCLEFGGMYLVFAIVSKHILPRIRFVFIFRDPGGEAEASCFHGRIAVIDPNGLHAVAPSFSAVRQGNAGRPRSDGSFRLPRRGNPPGRPHI